MTDKINGLSGIDPLKQNQQVNKANQTLGQDEFLRILMAQVQNQDPLSPQENGDFLGQMAQFSSLNGINDLTDQFKQVAQNMQSSQALQASSLVGRNVRVEANSAQLTTSGLTGAMSIAPDINDVKVNIIDGSGSTVQTLLLGSQVGDQVEFSWDGKMSNGAQASLGEYRLEAFGIRNNENVQLPVMADIKVESVSLGNSGVGMKLNLQNKGQVGLSDILQVRT